MSVSFTPGSVGTANPISAVDRLPSVGGAVSGAVVNFTQINSRDRAQERISRQARRLRGWQGGTPNLALVGRNDSLEQLIVQMGVIPIICIPSTTSLTDNIQCPVARRPAATENVFVIFPGPASLLTFTPAGPMQAAVFTASGASQVLSASDSVDAGAKGRALSDPVPA